MDMHIKYRTNAWNVFCTEERCGDIVVEGGVGQIIIAMKTFKQSSGIQTWGAYALCRILYRNSKCTDILEYTHYICRDQLDYSLRTRVTFTHHTIILQYIYSNNFSAHLIFSY